MRHVLFAIICISIFLPTSEAQALFGRRGGLFASFFGRSQFAGARRQAGGGSGARRGGSMRGRRGGCGSGGGSSGGGCSPGGASPGGGCSPGGASPGGGCSPGGGGSCGPNGCSPEAPAPQNVGVNGCGCGEQSGCGGQCGPNSCQCGNNSRPEPRSMSHGNGSSIPVGRPVNPNVPSLYSSWDASFNSPLAEKVTDNHIFASANISSDDGAFNYTVIEQDCVSKTDPNRKIPSTLILFNSTGPSGADQSHVAFVPGTITGNVTQKVEETWRKVTASPSETSGGKLRSVGDSFQASFSLRGFSDFPETQIQLKKIIKNGHEEYMSKYIHKHRTSQENDAPFYCENRR